MIARLFVAACLAAGLALGTMASSASATHTAPRHIACTQTSDGDLNQSAGWGEVDWESVGCPGEWLIRARLLCASRFGGTVYAYSGKVESNELEAKAQCPSDHSQLQVFWQQFNINGGSWSTCEYYPTRTCSGTLKQHYRLAA